MIIAIGADHRGFAQKEFIKKEYTRCEWIDVGTFDSERTDYPCYADAVAALLLQAKVDYGVLLCGSGGGMAMAANRYKKVYAVVAWNVDVAQRCKQEDNANILVIPSDFVSDECAVEMVRAWLEAEFKGGRYAERIMMIEK